VSGMGIPTACDQQAGPKESARCGPSESRVRDSSGADAEGMVSAKLSLPQQGFLMPRLRLRALLEPIRAGGVASIVAGPGYGKTAFLVDTVLAQRLPAVYFGLGTEDCDAGRFVRLLLQGVRRKRPELGCRAWQRLEHSSDPRSDAVELVSDFLEEVNRGRREPLALLFEDVHIIESSPDVTAILQLLVDSLPASWTVLFTSRNQMPLTLTDQFDRGRVVEVDLRLLRLTPGEVALWAEQVWGIALGREEARALWRLTHGWPVSLVLLGQRLVSGGRVPERDELAALLRKGSRLADYLARNVFGSLRRPTAEVLKRAAFLPRIVFPRDAALFPDGELAEREFEWLTARGFLVTRTGRRTFTLHPLVQTFAERELDAESSELARLEKVRAAEHLARAGEVSAAVSLHLSAADYPAAARLLEGLARGSLNVSLVYTNPEWLRMLPDALVRDNAWLCIARGRMRQSAADFQGAESDYHAGAVLAEQAGDWSALLQSSLGLVFCCYLTGRAKKGIELIDSLQQKVTRADETVELMVVKANLLLEVCDWDAAAMLLETASLIGGASSEFSVRIDTLRSKLFFVKGNIRNALNWALKAMQTSDRCASEVRLGALHGLAVARLLHGDYEEASRKLRACSEIATRRNHGHLGGTLLLSEAGIELGSGNTARGLTLLRRSVEVCRMMGDVESELWASDMLGDLFRRNRNPQKALEVHDRSWLSAKERSLGPLVRVRARTAMGMDLAVLGRYAEAEETLTEASRGARRHGLEGSLCHCLLYLGWLQAKSGRESLASSTLKEGLRLVQEHRGIHFLLQEATVAVPIYALAERHGAGGFLKESIIPRLGDGLQRYFQQLAGGLVYPTDVALGPSRMPRFGPETLERSSGSRGEAEDKVARLTEREAEILGLIALGLPNKEIGRKLFITDKTVKTHAYKLFRKLEVTSRLQAAILFQQSQKEMAGRQTHVHHQGMRQARPGPEGEKGAPEKR
jgi:ATP/maltotriose-dependent transcriptional regulator MalT